VPVTKEVTDREEDIFGEFVIQYAPIFARLSDPEFNQRVDQLQDLF